MNKSILIYILAQKSSVPHSKQQEWDKIFLGVYRLLFVGCFCFFSVIYWGLGTPFVQAENRTAGQTATSYTTIPPYQIYLPLVTRRVAPASGVACPAQSTSSYRSIAIMGEPTDRPAPRHADLNLALRRYHPVTATLNLVDTHGDADSDPPQLAGLFTPVRLPIFMGAYQVYDWDWSCGEEGCRGRPLAQPAVTLLEMATTQGEVITAPPRRANVYPGGYKVMVLYAETHRVTLVYTRDDTVASGYVVHLEDLCVDSNLLRLYQTLDAQGRTRLPTLQDSQILGTARIGAIKVAIRDRGTFMEPRSRKDWWQGY